MISQKQPAWLILSLILGSILTALCCSQAQPAPQKDPAALVGAWTEDERVTKSVQDGIKRAGADEAEKYHISKAEISQTGDKLILRAKPDKGPEKVFEAEAKLDEDGKFRFVSRASFEQLSINYGARLTNYNELNYGPGIGGYHYCYTPIQGWSSGVGGGHEVAFVVLWHRLGPHFKLSNFQVVGNFEPTATETAPPFTPTWVVDQQGHFVVKFPASWLGEGTTNQNIDVYFEESKDNANSWIHDKKVDRPIIDRNDDPRVDWVAFRLDDLFGDWNNRSDGLFRISLDVGGVIHNSPLFTPADINTASILAVNARCLDLLGIPYDKWNGIYQRNPEEAKIYLWRQIYLRALGFNPSVDLLNLGEDNQPFTISLRVNAKFKSKGEPQTFVTVPVHLGKFPTEVKEFQVPGGEMRHLIIEPFALANDKDVMDSRRALEELNGFEVEPLPDDATVSQKLTIPVDENLKARFNGSRAKLTLGTAMREFGPKFDGSLLEAPLELFKRAFDAVWVKDVPPSAHEVYRKARNQAEQEYEAFRAIVQKLKDQKNQWGDTGLVDLELQISKYNGWKIGFGVPRSSSADLVSATGERSGLTRCGDLSLTNSTWTIGVSAIGAFFNPEFSLAMDTSLMKGSGSAPASDTRKQKLTKIPGIDDWLWETDASYARHELLLDPAIAAAFDRLINSNDGQLPATIAKMLDAPEFNHVMGELNELAFRAIIEKRVENLRKSQPEFSNSIFHVSGEDIKGPTLDKGRGKGSSAPRKLTDGITFKKMGKQKYAIPEMYEAKSSQTGADGIASQFAKDVLRIKNDGLYFENTSPEVMAHFDQTTPNFHIPPEQLLIPSNDPGMYVSLVPKAVVPKTDLKVPNAEKMRDEVKIRELTEQEKSAIRRGVEKNTEQAEYNSKGLETFAKLMLQRAGKMPSRWNDTGLTLDQFKKMVSDSGLSEPEVVAAFTAGQRWNPESGEMVDVFKEKPYERPFLSKQQIVEEWKTAVSITPSDPKWARESAKAEAEADKGNRYIPDATDPRKGKWISPVKVEWGKIDVDWGRIAEMESIKQRLGSASSKDKTRLAKLEGSLSDDEKSLIDSAKRLGLSVEQLGADFRNRLEALKKDGKLAVNEEGEVPTSVVEQPFEGGVNDPFLSDESYLELVRALMPPNVATDKEIVESRHNGRLFDTAKRTFREPTLDEKARQAAVNSIKGNQKLMEIYKNHVELQHDLGWAAVEGLQRGAALFKEIARRREEGLLVSFYCDEKNKILQLDVIPKVIADSGAEIRIPLGPSQQKEMLRGWYRHAGHVFTEGPVPDWLKK
ncbi:MAG TPA: hypothetical protein VEP30_05015 [Chthoniobacterales bacterium]|nr:hypothetical protein [Chthoniobacterales bacterium]